MRGRDSAAMDGGPPPQASTVGDACTEPVSRPGRPTFETLEAEFSIEHEDLVLTPTSRTVPSVTIQPDAPTAGGADTEYLFFSVYGADLDRFEVALADDPTLDDVAVVGSFEDHRVYRGLVATDAMTVSSILSALAVRILAVESNCGGWTLRVQLPDRDALVDFRDHCLDRGISFHVRKLAESDGEADTSLGLTDHQQETLLTAFARGYYEVPRGISQAELAEELGVSPSAISQRLRLAVGRLLEERFDAT